MKITGFCIRRPITTGAFFVALMILGFISSAKMPIDLLPQVTYPSINISTNYSGAGPEEIERLITIPIERAVATINGVDSITSHSQEGSSRVSVNFTWGQNLEEATNDIRANLDRVRGRLPDDADTPVIRKYDPSTAPVLTLGLSGQMDEVSLRSLAEDELSYQLQRAEGVANVEVRGGRKQEIRVLLKQDRLQALNLTAEQLASKIDKENAMVPAGHLAVGVGDFLLRTNGEFQNLDEIRDTVIDVRDGAPIYLKDVATIEEGFNETSKSIVRIDGKPGIMLSVYKRSGSNTVAVADNVYKLLNQLEDQYPGIKLRVLNDDSIYIRRAVRSVSDAAVIGAFLAAAILLFFFHSFRVTLITAIAMPISILGTLMLAYFGKMTLNTISLGGLALGVGMLVDNAVVVLDNIFRHRQRDNIDIATAALEGTAEMGPAISASTLTHICVFFPLLYLTGRNGIIYKELSYMVIFSILCSLLVAVTLIPMLCAKFLKTRDMEEVETKGLQGRLIRVQRGWEDSYEKTLDWCLKHKFSVITSCLGLFLATLTLYPFIGSELVQNTDEGVISVRLTMPIGTRIEETDLNSQNIERNLKRLVPELNVLQVSLDSDQTNRSSITARLKPKAERKRSTQEIVDDLQKSLKLAGSNIRISAPSSMRRFYGSNDNPIQVDVRGYDQELTNATAREILDKISAIPGVVNADYSREEERPELAIMINRKRAADYGISAEQIADAVQANIQGKVATTYRKNGDEFQVRVNLQESDRKSWRDLGRILVSGNDNRMIPLTSIIDLQQTNSPVTIDHTDQERNISVTAGLSNRDLSSAMTDVKKVVSGVNLPDGVMVYYGGDYEEQTKSYNELMVSLILSLILIYMVMAAQFESFFDPFVIMLSVPFALGGVLIILLLTDTLFNSQVYIGLIMLGGIVVNNAIVLISYIRILIERGSELNTAVLKGARSRLRPILITTATTILGLLPLALGIGEGSETQTPLARTVIGGLLFSTILTLILIPVIFSTLENRLKHFKTHFFKSKAKAVTIGVLVLIAIIAIPSGPVRAAETKKLTVFEAVGLALQNYEETTVFKDKRAIAISAYQESIGENGLKIDSTLELPSETSSSDRKKIGLGFEKPLGTLTRQVEEYNKDISLLKIDYQEQQLIYNVISAFQRELLAIRDVQLAEENLERSQKVADEIQARSKLGLTNISDEIGAEAQKVTAEANLNRSRQQYQLARQRLREYLNLPETVELELVPAARVEQRVDQENLLKEAQDKRADLQEACLEVARAETLLKLAKLAEQMEIEISWTWERDNQESKLSLSNDTSSGEWIVSGGITGVDPDFNSDSSISILKVTWTLWDGRARQENTKQARLLVDQLSAELQKTKKNITYEVREAYFNYLAQIDRIRSGEVQLRYNKTYFEATQAKMRNGLATVKDLLDAQVLLHQAESEYEQARSDLYLARINLMKVTGVLNAAQKDY